MAERIASRLSYGLVPAAAMLTGYNSDLLHQGIVMHVQTEDKGDTSQTFESVVYVGGRVLAVERMEYAEAVVAGATPEELSRLMDGHHQRVIEAIKAGEFNELLADFQAGSSAEPAAETHTEETGEADAAHGQTAAAVQLLAEELLAETEEDLERIQFVLEEPPGTAVGEPVHARLRLIVGRDRPLAEVPVTVELISPVAPPQTLTESSTDADGRVELEFELPVREGEAALVFTAEDDELGSVEITHLL